MALVRTYKNHAAGQFVEFTYSPKGLSDLDQYDKHPLLLFVNFDNVYGLVSGLNLHWITVSQRAKLIDYMLRKYTKNDLAEFGRPVNFSWDNIKSAMPELGIAWRRYFPNRMRNVKVIAPHWEWEEVKNDVINSQTERILKVTPELIQKHYAESQARKMRVLRQRQRETLARNKNIAKGKKK